MGGRYRLLDEAMRRPGEYEAYDREERIEPDIHEDDECDGSLRELVDGAGFECVGEGRPRLEFRRGIVSIK